MENKKNLSKRDINKLCLLQESLLQLYSLYKKQKSKKHRGKCNKKDNNIDTFISELQSQDIFDSVKPENDQDYDYISENLTFNIKNKKLTNINLKNSVLDTTLIENTSDIQNMDILDNFQFEQQKENINVNDLITKIKELQIFIEQNTNDITQIKKEINKNSNNNLIDLQTAIANGTNTTVEFNKPVKLIKNNLADQTGNKDNIMNIQKDLLNIKKQINTNDFNTVTKTDDISLLIDFENKNQINIDNKDKTNKLISKADNAINAVNNAANNNAYQIKNKNKKNGRRAH